jgi:hypothetical protein
MRILFYCGFYYFTSTSVVTQMNDFCSQGLHDPAHDVDGSIVTIK